MSGLSRRDFVRSGALPAASAPPAPLPGYAPGAPGSEMPGGIICELANTGIRVVRVPESPIRGVVLDDVPLRSTPAPHEIRHVAGFVARDVRINGERLSLPSTIA